VFCVEFSNLLEVVLPFNFAPFLKSTSLASKGWQRIWRNVHDDFDQGVRLGNNEGSLCGHKPFQNSNHSGNQESLVVEAATMSTKVAEIL
jgi:hypothetical protein